MATRPHVVHYSLDATHYRDPIGQGALKTKHGSDEAVLAFMEKDPKVRAFINMMTGIAVGHLVREKYSYLCVGIHDKRGTQISPAIGELLARSCEAASLKVSVTNG